MTMHVHWTDSGREPQVAPNPTYPNGIDIDATEGAKNFCTTKLPYPARRCGYYSILCDVCNTHIIVTTAGRPDDPRSLKMACRFQS